MSAVFNAQTKSLLATFSGTIPAFDDHVLISCWVKWDSTQTQGSMNMALEMVASDASFLRVGTNSTNKVSASLDHPNAATVSRNTAGTYDEDAWIQFSAYVSPSSGDLVSYGPYLGTASNIGSVSAAASTVAFSTIRVGQGGSLNEFSPWKGKIAEVSVWLPADATEAAAIVAELATTKADAVAGSYAPIWYATLESDATVAVGASLTNNGTTGFDGADNPSLAGADTTAPTLTSVSGASTSPTAATISATTDEAGPAWAVYTGSATQPTKAQVKAGQDHTGSTTGVFADTATLAIGANPAAFSFTGMTPEGVYYPHVVQDDTASPVNTSEVESGSSVTMPALPIKATVTLYQADGTTPAASITGLQWAWWDDATPDLSLAADISGTGASTNGSGVFDVTLTGTALTLGQTGTLLIYKTDGTAESTATLAFCGPLETVN